VALRAELKLSSQEAILEFTFWSFECTNFVDPYRNISTRKEYIITTFGLSSLLSLILFRYGDLVVYIPKIRN